MAARGSEWFWSSEPFQQQQYRRLGPLFPASFPHDHWLRGLVTPETDAVSLDRRGVSAFGADAMEDARKTMRMLHHPNQLVFHGMREQIVSNSTAAKSLLQSLVTDAMKMLSDDDWERFRGAIELQFYLEQGRHAAIDIDDHGRVKFYRFDRSEQF